MKKIMIAAAIVCAAAMSQAATYNWNVTLNDGLYKVASTEMLGSGNAYIFVSGAANYGSQDAVLSALLANSATVAEMAAANGGSGALSISNGFFPRNPMSTTTTDGAASVAETVDLFAVIDAGDGTYFLDDTFSYTYDQTTKTGEVGLNYGDWTGSDDPDYGSDFRGDTSFSYGGWYGGATPTPEPTSGLLLLLGVAGLALKRKRA